MTKENKKSNVLNREEVDRLIALGHEYYAKWKNKEEEINNSLTTETVEGMSFEDQKELAAYFLFKISKAMPVIDYYMIHQSEMQEVIMELAKEFPGTADLLRTLQTRTRTYLTYKRKYNHNSYSSSTNMQVEFLGDRIKVTLKKRDTPFIGFDILPHGVRTIVFEETAAYDFNELKFFYTSTFTNYLIENINGARRKQDKEFHKNVKSFVYGILDKYKALEGK